MNKIVYDAWHASTLFNSVSHTRVLNARLQPVKDTESFHHLVALSFWFSHTK